MSGRPSALQGLIESYYRAWFRYHPEAAVDAGVPGYASLLRPYGDDDLGALVALHEKLLAALDELDAAALDDEERLDFDVLRGAALLEHHELLERDWRERDPTRFLPVHAIYQLTVRAVADPGAALRDRLSAIPGHLRGARAHLGANPEAIPALWLEAAIAEAHSGADYLRGLHEHPQVGPWHVERLLDDAAHALDDFGHFLARDLAPRAAGDVACGRAHFERLLRYRHFLEVDAATLYRLGERLVAETAGELRAVTRALHGDENIAALHAALAARHVPDGALLDHYRRAMQAARDFVAGHALVTMPAAEQLKVVETPPFLRHRIPFAAYQEPLPSDPEQRGLYYVTPPQDAAARAAHDTLSLRHTCVHEAWPGHHLQFVTANRSPASRALPRLLNPSATLYEGWALYCEQLMQEQGFLEGPESRFVLLRDRLWRALRIMIDVGLHCRGLGVDEAAACLQRELGFTPAQARGEITWYSQSPAVPMGYATGWALIDAARTRLQAVEPAFTLRGFHDRLLGAGSIGLPLVLRSRFGAPFWANLAQDVFGGP